jgi:hypothetical protein
MTSNKQKITIKIDINNDVIEVLPSEVVSVADVTYADKQETCISTIDLLVDLPDSKSKISQMTDAIVAAHKVLEFFDMMHKFGIKSEDTKAVQDNFRLILDSFLSGVREYFFGLSDDFVTKCVK